jgi:putative ABC transport system ATP-binding protein
MGVQLSHVKKTFTGPDGSAVPVIDVPAFSIGEGQRVALIGSSGSGKTTLLHLIAGILLPDEGSIAIDGTDITTLSEARRDLFRGDSIGYIFQTHHLLPGFTAMENVLLGMSFTGRGTDKAWATHLLNEVGLSDRLNYRPAKLSVGQQQRVAVARAMANRPKVVLADEPTGALDAVNAKLTLDLILRLCVEVNAALILVTHDLEIAAALPSTLKLSEINRAAKRFEDAAGAMRASAAPALTRA